jgi:branched-chain amino acid transport system substrate-binding protein
VPRMLAAALLAAAQLAAPTVYSSLPLHGPARAEALATQRGEQLALADAGNPVELVTLDDARRDGWRPELAAENARRAAQDGHAIGYIGEFNSGASMVSLPILNEARVPMISPSNTAPGLTRRGPGTQPGEPDKYYPTGERTYFRLAPTDQVQGAALGAQMRRAGCRRAALLDDREVYGAGIAGSAARGVAVVARRHVARRAHYTTLARGLRQKRVDCVLFGGVTANGAVALFRDVGRALPHAKLFGSDGIADATFARRIPRGVARRTLITAPTLAPADYPAAGQRVIAAYHDVYAAYGYEAMRLFIDAYAAAGAKRPAILDWLHGVRHRQGVIGTYSFDRAGDTTVRTVGLYAIRGGAFTAAGTVTG